MAMTNAATEYRLPVRAMSAVHTRGAMPPMIAAMDKKISSQRGRPPQGMTSDAWKATVKSYDEARDAWGKAATEITSKNFEATVLAARDAKSKIAGIMETLGVKAS